MSTKSAPTEAAPTNTFEYGSAYPEDLGIIGDNVEPKPGEHVDPRLRYPVNETLAKDLDINGQEQEIVVFRDGKRSKMLIVDEGQQRTRAMRTVNAWRAAGVAPSGKTERMTIRYRVVVKGTTLKERFLARLAENSDTMRVSDNAAVNAENIAFFLKEYGDTEENVEALCTRMGLSKRRYNDLIALRESAPEVVFEAAKKGASEPGGLGVEAALAVQDLPEERQREIAEELKQEAAAAKKAEAEGKKPEPVSKKTQQKRSAAALREEATVAKAKAKGVAKYVKPSSTMRKDWSDSIKHWNKVRKGEGKEPLTVNAFAMFEWLAGNRATCPLVDVYKAEGYPIDND